MRYATERAVDWLEEEVELVREAKREASRTVNSDVPKEVRRDSQKLVKAANHVLEWLRGDARLDPSPELEPYVTRLFWLMHMHERKR